MNPEISDNDQQIGKLSSDLGQFVPRPKESNANYTQQELLSRAEQGDPEAQYDLGNLYSNYKPGIDQDDDLAWHWHFKAAEQGHTLATASVILKQYETPYRFPPERPWSDEAATVQGTVTALNLFAERKASADALLYLGLFNLFGIDCDCLTSAPMGPISGIA